METTVERRKMEDGVVWVVRVGGREVLFKTRAAARAYRQDCKQAGQYDFVAYLREQQRKELRNEA